MTDNFDNEPEVVSAIGAGNTIGAIKALRQSRGIGLKQAKELVDAYRDFHGIDNSASSSGKSSGLSLLVVVGLVAFGYYFFKG